MRKIIIVSITLLMIVLASNLILFYFIKNRQIELHKKMLADQTGLAAKYIENNIKQYETELNNLIQIVNNDLHLIFIESKNDSYVLQQMKKFYYDNKHILSNLSIYDNLNHYLGIYIKENNEFVVDTFSRQRVNILHEHIHTTRKDEKYLSYIPFYKNNILAGNVVAEINLIKFVNSVLSLYSSDKYHWQWLVDDSAEILTFTAPIDINVSINNSIPVITESKYPGVLLHSLTNEPDKKNILSAFYPLSILNNDLNLVFSIQLDKIISPFSKNYLLLILSNIVVFTFLITFIYWLLTNEYRKNEDLSVKLLSYKMIIEQFPVGIMILNKYGIITNINLTAQKMLFLETDHDIIGRNFNDHFLVSNKYLLKESLNLPFDDNHFILYEKDENEVIIYRKELKTYIAGEELTISALIDISPFEKSRKQEVAANLAKLDFLAKMSHEIRTPMNGIVGMTDNLLRSDLSEDYKEQVKIIKKSSAILMNVINDILDFSKIEAGKMMLEEIPFNVADEIKFTIDLYKSLADEKQIELKSIIKPEVPLNIIGDPFRLRQVLSNLLSNAIKFTDTGLVAISVELIDKHNSTIILLFSVEDTGIGISKENIRKIFRSFEQAKTSTSRKYGGTGLGTSIAQQLVEMMNGEIWVESPGKLSKNPKYPGSRFCFTIESHSNEKLNKKFSFEHITQYQQISALILSKIRDENDRIHAILDSFGISYDYNLYDDKMVDKIVSEVDKQKSIYQIIVIKDKPNNDCFKLARKFKEKKLTDYFLCIMVSSNDIHGNYLRARNLGMDYYLIQPYESNEVYKILRENFPGIPEKKYMGSQISQIRPELKILVVDDNIVNQRVIQTVFKHLGYEVEIAVHGGEAVKMFQANEYDIIFMDLLMPVMDGFSATREIRMSNTAVPVIALSASEDQNSINEALKSGMNGYLIKPVKVESVKQLLIKWFSESI